MQNRNKIIIIVILILAAGLRLWGLGGPDVVTDEAINSFRAVGMVDLLSTEFQTMPMEWQSTRFLCALSAARTCWMCQKNG